MGKHNAKRPPVLQCRSDKDAIWVYRLRRRSRIGASQDSTSRARLLATARAMCSGLEPLEVRASAAGDLSPPWTTLLFLRGISKMSVTNPDHDEAAVTEHLPNKLNDRGAELVGAEG